MKTILLFIFLLLSLFARSQDNFTFTGEITEMVKLTDTGKIMEIVETYDPPRQCQIVLKPGIINVTIDGNTKVYYGIAPGDKDQEGNVSFLASDFAGGSPKVMLLRTVKGEIMFLYLDLKSQTSTGFYLRQ